MSSEENNTEKTLVNTNEKKDRNRKIKFILGGIFLVLAVAAGLWMGFEKLGNKKENKVDTSPLGIYSSVINDSYDIFNKLLKSIKSGNLGFDFANEPYKMEASAKIASSMDELKPLTGYTYTFNGGMDYKNKKFVMDLGISNGTNELTVSMANVNNYLYLKSTDIYSKVINLGKFDVFEEIQDEFGINYNLILGSEEYPITIEDFEYLLETYKNMLVDSFDKDYFTEEEEEITNSGKDIKVNKITYKLDKKNIERTVKFFIDKMLENDKLLDILAEATEVSKTEIVESLEEAKEDINYTGEDILIVVYANKDGNILEANLVVEDTKIVKYEVENGLKSITIDDGEAKLIYKETSDNNYNLKFIESSTEMLDLKIYSSSSDFKADYNVNVDGVKLSGKIELTNVKENNNKTSFDYNFSIDTTVAGEKIDLAVNGSVSMEFTDISVFDTSSSVNINSLTESDQTAIMNNLMKAAQNLGLQDLIVESN